VDKTVAEFEFVFATYTLSLDGQMRAEKGLEPTVINYGVLLELTITDVFPSLQLLTEGSLQPSFLWCNFLAGYHEMGHALTPFFLTCIFLTTELDFPGKLTLQRL
jgi:hypothetical protein